MSKERISYSVVSGNDLRGYNFSRQGIVSIAEVLPQSLKHVVVRCVKDADSQEHDLIAAFPTYAAAKYYADSQTADANRRAS